MEILLEQDWHCVGLGHNHRYLDVVEQPSLAKFCLQWHTILGNFLEIT